MLAVFDDLRPQLGAYGHPLVHSPVMDALAASNGTVLFTRAFTNYAYCSPSRNSFLSGRMPGTTKVLNFIDSFREEGTRDRAGLPGTRWTTLPGHFRANGYWTVGTGKVFHPNRPPDNDNAFGSWSENATDPGANVGCGCPAAGVPGAPMYCELPEDTDCPDVVIADTAVGMLRRWDRSAPFFVAMGIHKPHLPWGAPARAFAKYPPAADLPLAVHQNVPADMPAIAYHHCQWGPFPWNSTKGHPVDPAIQGLARRGYFAAITFADELLGRAIAELDRLRVADDTIVVVMSDHGWLLGEHNEWCKESTFENAVRVPLIVRMPGAGDRPPRRSTALVSNIDVYRTLSELAGLPEPEPGVDGASFAPLITAPDGPAALALRRTNFSAAFSQHARCLRNATDHYKPIDPYKAADSCTITPRDQIDFMGYSIRDRDWRLTLWVRWDGATLRPDWGRLNATELYDHRADTADADFDAFENANVAADQAHAPVIARLAGKLRTYFDSVAP